VAAQRSSGSVASTARVLQCLTRTGPIAGATVG
jgi:hypothetical protein